MLQSTLVRDLSIYGKEFTMPSIELEGPLVYGVAYITKPACVLGP